MLRSSFSGLVLIHMLIRAGTCQRTLILTPPCFPRMFWPREGHDDALRRNAAAGYRTNRYKWMNRRPAPRLAQKRSLKLFRDHCGISPLREYSNLLLPSAAKEPKKRESATSQQGRLGEGSSGRAQGLQLYLTESGVKNRTVTGDNQIVLTIIVSKELDNVSLVDQANPVPFIGGNRPGRSWVETSKSNSLRQNSPCRHSEDQTGYKLSCG